MKNLKQKIATGIVWLGGVGSLAGMVGCESPEGNMGLAALGNMAQVSPYATADDRTLGAGLSTIGQMGHNMNTAKAGRSEVNVNVNYPRNYQNESRNQNINKQKISSLGILVDLDSSEANFISISNKDLFWYLRYLKEDSEKGYVILTQRNQKLEEREWLKPEKVGKKIKYHSYSWENTPNHIKSDKIVVEALKYVE